MLRLGFFPRLASEPEGGGLFNACSLMLLGSIFGAHSCCSTLLWTRNIKRLVLRGAATNLYWRNRQWLSSSWSAGAQFWRERERLLKANLRIGHGPGEHMLLSSGCSERLLCSSDGHIYCQLAMFRTFQYGCRWIKSCQDMATLSRIPRRLRMLWQLSLLSEHFL